MSTTLPLFWNLSSANKKERLDASVKLVSALEHFQSNFVPKGSLETSEDEDESKKSDGLDALNAVDVAYTLRRLIRGLASPRESSRLGFAVALTEVRSIPFVRTFVPGSASSYWECDYAKLMRTPSFLWDVQCFLRDLGQTSGLNLTAKVAEQRRI